MGGPTNRSPWIIAPRSNSAPKDSLQHRAIPQSLDQCRGHCGLSAPCNAPFTQGVNTMRFHLSRTAVLFGLVALALMANGKKPVASVPERRSERLGSFRPSGTAGHAHVVVEERHIHHFAALGWPRRRAGFHHSEAFSIDHLYRHRHRPRRLGPCQHPSHYRTRDPSGCGPGAFPG
jgi:hypothetical protein